MRLRPGGVVSRGAFADPSMIFEVGMRIYGRRPAAWVVEGSLRSGRLRSQVLGIPVGAQLRGGSESWVSWVRAPREAWGGANENTRGGTVGAGSSGNMSVTRPISGVSPKRRGRHNSSLRRPLSLVGDTGFEPVTSTV